MKKILRKILAISASVFLLTSFVACGEGEDEDDQSGPVVPGGNTVNLWNDAVIVEELAGKQVNWDKGGPLLVSSDVSARLQEGSKIIVQLDYHSLPEGSDYIQFHVEDGNWGAVGVKDYYNAKNDKLDAVEETDNGVGCGRFKIDVKPGIYYTVVTADVLEKLKAGLGFGGNFKLVKIGITNLKAEEKVEDFPANGIGNVITFNVNANSTGTTNNITLKYLRTAKSAAEAITLKDAVYYVQHNNGKIKKVEGDIAFTLNNYGNCFKDDGTYLVDEGVSVTNTDREASGKYKAGSTELSDPQTYAAEYQCQLSYAEELKSGDTVKFQLVSATVVGEAKTQKDTILPKIKAVLVDAAPEVDYYKKLTDHLTGTVYPLVIKTGATVTEGEEVVDTEDHGLLDKAVSFVKWNNTKVAADKFTGLAVSDKIVLTYITNDEKDANGNIYHNLQLIWDADDNKKEFSGLSATTTKKTLEYIVDSAEKVTKITTGGITLQGHGVDLKKLTVEKGDGTVQEEQTGTVVKTMAVTLNHYNDADHGIQYTEDMTSIPLDAKAGDVWTLKIAGTADAEFRGDMQFVDAAWGGITGESVSKTFTTSAFDYEIDFTFSKDCSDGKFMLGNAGMDPAVAKTLSLTKYSFTKKSSASTSGESSS